MQLKSVDGRHAAISNRLRLIRDHYDLASKRFAEQAGVSVKSYSQWESGDFRISVEAAIAICDRFGVTLDYIYLGRIDTLPYSLAMSLKDANTKLEKALVPAE